jgi:hypothetical protein
MQQRAAEHEQDMTFKRQSDALKLQQQMTQMRMAEQRQAEKPKSDE